MKFQGIKKVFGGRFINRYDLEYMANDGRIKTYEIISRKKDIQSLEELTNAPSEGVVIIAHSEDGERLLLNKEFRLSINRWIFGFPAGLIDAGETAEIAAKRELMEETGTRLVTVKEVLPPSYTAVGFCNETVETVICTAEGEPVPSPDPMEEIVASWYTKEEVKKLMATEAFAARTQSYCYQWCQE